jgi:hypothetical protein
MHNDAYARDLQMLNASLTLGCYKIIHMHELELLY